MFSLKNRNCCDAPRLIVFLFLMIFSHGAFAAQITVSASPGTVNEGSSATVTVEYLEEASDTLPNSDDVGSSDFHCTVDFSISNSGTALLNSDYTVSQPLSFSFTASGTSGSTQSRSLTYTTVGEDGIEPSEYISISVTSTSQNSNCIVNSTASTSIDIINQDFPSTISATLNQSTASVNEGAGSTNIASVTFNEIDGGSPNAACLANAELSVVGGTAILGRDFNVIASSVSASSSSSPFTLNILPGSAGDGDKTIQLQATLVDTGSTDCSVGSVSPQQFTVRIVDTPIPALNLIGSFGVNLATIQEGSGAQVVGNVAFQIPSGQADSYCSASASVNVVGGTALAGTDFNFTPVPLTFVSGNNESANVSLEALPGVAGDGDKTVILEATFVSAGGANGLNSCPLGSITPQRHTITIQDTPIPVLGLTNTFNVNRATVQEGSGAQTVGSIVLQLPSGQTADNYCLANATVRVVGGTAQIGTDYNFTPTPVNFGNGDTNQSATVNLEALTGVAGDGDKTVILEAVFVSNGANGFNSCPLVNNTPQRQTITLKDSSPVTLNGSVNQTVTQVEENQGAVNVGEIVFTLGSGMTADANCKATATTTLAGGTATQGSDFGFSPVTLNFTQADSSSKRKAINVNVLAGIAGDGDKTVILKTVFNSVGGATGNSCPFATKTVTSTVIIQDTPISVLGLTNTFNVNRATIQEGSGAQTVGRIVLQVPSGQTADNYCLANATVRVVGGTAQAGTDYNFTPTPVNFGNGNTNQSATVNLEALAGVAGDGDKTVVLEAVFVSNGANGFNSCPLANDIRQRKTITLKDSPSNTLRGSVSQRVTEVAENQGNVNVGEIVFTLGSGMTADANCKATATITLAGGTATAGRDFSFTPVTLNFAQGDNSPKRKAINVNVLAGIAGDGNKTISLKTVFNSVGGATGNSCPFATNTVTSTITIQDSSIPVTGLTGTLNVNRATVQEGSGTQTIGSITLEVPAGQAADRYCIANTLVRVVGGTAKAGTDFKFTTTPLAFGIGNTNKTAPINLEALAGVAGDGNKTVILEAVFVSNGANGFNSCPMANSSPQRKTITLQDSPSSSLNGSVSQGVTQVAENQGNVNVGNIVFTLGNGMTADANCKATATTTLAGGTATQGRDFNFTPVTLVFGQGDSSTKRKAININVLAGTAGDGNKTISLKTVFNSVGGATGNSCPFASKTVTSNISITDDPFDPLAVSLSFDNTTLVEGDVVNVVVKFSDTQARSWAARSINNCQVSAKWTPTGTARQADYIFSFPSVLNYSSSSQQLMYPLRLLTDADLEPNETLGFILRLSSAGIANACQLTSQEVAAEPVRLRDASAEGRATQALEPEDVYARACDALEQRQQQTGEPLAGKDRSFYVSNCNNVGNGNRNGEPEEVAAQVNAVIIGLNQQLRNIRSRLDSFRGGQTRRGVVDVSGVDVKINGTSVPGETFAVGGSAGDETNELLSGSRWGLFASGDYAFGERRRSGDDQVLRSGDRNFDFKSTGLTIGADYRLPGDKFIVGGAIGYKDFDADFTTQEGFTANKGYNLSFYGSYLATDKIYLDAITSFGQNTLDSRRPVNNDGSLNIGNTTTFAIGKPDAKEFLFSVGGGYEFNKGEWSVIPYGRVDYLMGKIDPYTEKASHSSAETSLFSFDKQNIDSLTSTIGVRATRVISTSKGVFTPQASLEWKHEYKDRGTISGTSLYVGSEEANLGVSGNFLEQHADNYDRDYFNLGFGVSAVFPKGRSGYLNFETRFGDDQITDNAIKAGIRIEF